MSGTTINIPEIRIVRVGMSDRPEDITGTGEIPEELRRLVEGIENQFKANREEDDEIQEITADIRKMAQVERIHYTELVKAGFTEEQAFELVKAVAGRK